MLEKLITELLGQLSQASNYPEQVRLIITEKKEDSSSELLAEIFYQIRLANAYLYAGRLDLADNFFKNAVANIQSRLPECSQDLVLEQCIEVCALIGRFNLAFKAGGTRQANTFFERANHILSACDDKLSILGSGAAPENLLPLMLLRDVFYGNMLSFTGDNTAAITVLTDAFVKTKRHDEQPSYLVLAVALLNALALAKFRVRDFGAALDHLNASTVLSRQMKYFCGEAEALRLKGIIHSAQHRLTDAILALNQAYELNETLQYRFGVVKALSSLGINYSYGGAESKHAEYCFRRAIEITKSCGFQSELGQLYSRMGDILMVEGRFETAEKYYEKDLELTARDDSVRRKAYVHRNLGRIRQIQNKLIPAIADFTKALEWFESVEDKTNASHVALRLCQCLVEKGMIKESKALEKKARETFGSGETFESALCDMMLGSIYRAEKKYEAACQILEKSLNAQKRFPQAYAGLHTKLELALAYRALDDQAAYKAQLKEIIQIARHMRIQDVEEKALKMLQAADEKEWVRMRNIVFLGVSSDSQENRVIDVTVMYVDIRNYTALTEQTEVKNLAEFVNDFFVLVSRKIYAHNGVVNKYIGDCVMSIFGLYEEDEIMEKLEGKAGAASSAVMAAKEIHRSVGLLRNRYHFTKDVEVGIGIASGPVVAGYFGSRERMEFSVIGSTVNLASRLQNHSNLGLGIICANTAGLLGDLPGVVDHPPVSCKGFAELVAVKGIDYSLFPSAQDSLERGEYS